MTRQSLPEAFRSLNRTQFLGALNDNLFKLMVILFLLQGQDLGASQVAALAGGLFVLPFLLLSPLAGRLADRMSKGRIIRRCKIAELAVMALGLIGLMTEQSLILYVAVFGTAAQSALFGPSKYGILPELVNRDQLSQANGRLEAATYLAIILGTALATVLPFWMGSFRDAGLVCVLISLFGLWAAQHVPETRSVDRLPIGWRRELAQVRVLMVRDKDLGCAILASAAFLFLAAFVQLNLIPFGMDNLGLTSPQSSALFLVMAVGVTLGALVAGKLSDRLPEMGLVPVGALGLCASLIGLATVPSVTVTLICLAILGVSGGLFLVPLHTFVQWKSPERYRGRLLAVSSWLGWWGVLGASGLVAGVDAGLGWTPAGGFWVAALLSAVLAVATLRYLADILLRFMARVVINTLYRFRVTGSCQVPATGPALLVANHVSYIDSLVLLASQPRRIRFLMDREVFNNGWFRPFCRLMGVIPISAKDRPRTLARALSRARQALDDGQLVAIFAEGALTRNGQLGTFRSGFERIVQGTEHPVIPVYLDGLWGSSFSFAGGQLFTWPTEWHRSIQVRFGVPMASDAKAPEVRRVVETLACEQALEEQAVGPTLGENFVEVARRNWRKEAVADSTGQRMTYGELLTAAVALSKALPVSTDHPNVPLLLPPSTAGTLANLAVTLRGKVPANLNYTLSTEGFSTCLNACGDTPIFTARKVVRRLPEELPLNNAIYLEELVDGLRWNDKLKAWVKARLLPMRWWMPKVKSHQQAVLLFSSGSTGTPKGICLSHRNLQANLQGLSRVFDLRDADRLCGVLPLFHALGLTGTLWLPLLNGSVVSYHANPLDAKTIGKLVEKDRCSLLLATPTFLQSYIRRIKPEAFDSLRLVMTGAEKLRLAVADSFEERFGLRPLEGYGTTELAPVATLNLPPVKVGGMRQVGSREGSVGRPLPGVEIEVRCPETDRPLPLGDEGLVHVRGANVMEGYLDRPELTAEVVRDGWYRTGDLGRVDEDGYLFITDRLNRFSKIGGEMVPHGAIEDALLHGVESEGPALVVTGVPDEKKGERLVVLYTAAAGHLEEVVRRAKDRLPNLWQPAQEAFVAVDHLPLLGTGKVDLKGIRQMALAAMTANA